MDAESKKEIGLEIGHVLVWAVSQRLILAGEQSGLQTHIATMESVSLCVRMNC